MSKRGNGSKSPTVVETNVNEHSDDIVMTVMDTVTMVKTVKQSNESEYQTLAEIGAVSNNDESQIKYGELVILGYNGFLPPGNRGRKRSKFVLCKRDEPNGVKKSKHYVVPSLDCAKAKLYSQQHSVSYTLSPNQTVIVEYEQDVETDMFQIGRSIEPTIDFVVLDKLKDCKRSATILLNGKKEVKVMPTTISRFACRIMVERSGASKAKVFAAGFDSNRNIFLGEKATKWQNDLEIDGLTTNGVLVMHPTGQFCGGNAKCGIWHECSIGGDIFSMRGTRSSQQKGRKMQEETNVLKDGTLINLGGTTLLWRSAEGLKMTPRNADLKRLVEEMNADRSQLIGSNTLTIPRDHTSRDQMYYPYVNLNCGHVEGNYDWKEEDSTDKRMCKKCVKVGPIVRICMGMETAFYVDSGPPIFAFSPCGHVTTEATVKYWSSVDIPHGTEGFQAECPFCGTPLLEYPGYIKLLF